MLTIVIIIVIKIIIIVIFVVFTCYCLIAFLYKERNLNFCLHTDGQLRLNVVPADCG